MEVPLASSDEELVAEWLSKDDQQSIDAVLAKVTSGAGRKDTRAIVADGVRSAQSLEDAKVFDLLEKCSKGAWNEVYEALAESAHLSQAQAVKLQGQAGNNENVLQRLMANPLPWDNEGSFKAVIREKLKQL